MSNQVPRMPGCGCHRLPAWEAVCVCVCVCAHMRVSALCLHVYTHMHVWLCVQKPTCAQACGPSATQRPPPQDLGLCCSHCTELHLCRWEATLIPPGHLPCSSPGARASWEHTCSPLGPGCNQPPGGCTQAVPQWGVRPAGSVVLHVLPVGPRCNRPPGGHTQAVPQWGVRFIPV